MEKAWDAAGDARQYGVLGKLAELAVEFGDDKMASRIVDGLGGSVLSSCPLTVRESPESSLAQMGELGLETLLDRLSDSATADSSCQWFLDLFVSLNPARHCSLIVRFYRGLEQAAQELMVDRICELTSQSWGFLFDLMGAVLQRLPPDPRLVEALQARIGKKQLENDAIKWASRGHKGARIVLQRRYDYPATVFDAH